MELRVGNRYRLGRKIGSGSFGDIYLGEKTWTDLLFSSHFLSPQFITTSYFQHSVIVCELVKYCELFARCRLNAQEPM